MKKHHLFLVLFVLIAISLFVMSACQSKEESDVQNNETTAYVQTSAEDESTSTAASEYTEVSIEDTTDSDVYYTQDENEMEIMTVPNNQDNTSTENNGESTDAPLQTEPENPFTQDEPIELPFVPVE